MQPLRPGVGCGMPSESTATARSALRCALRACPCIVRTDTRPCRLQAVLLQTGVLRRSTVRPITPEMSTRLVASLRSSSTSFSMQQAANVVSTMALLGLHDFPLMAAIVDHVMPELPTADPATIASLCYALGLDGYSDHRLLRVLLRLLLLRTHRPVRASLRCTQHAQRAAAATHAQLMHNSCTQHATAATLHAVTLSASRSPSRSSCSCSSCGRLRASEAASPHPAKPR
jgi:hypothetical protein